MFCQDDVLDDCARVSTGRRARVKRTEASTKAASLLLLLLVLLLLLQQLFDLMVRTHLKTRSTVARLVFVVRERSPTASFFLPTDR